MSQEKLQELFARCWKDEAFRKRFKSEPAAVLDEEGFDVPEGIKVKVIENSPNEMNIVLPANPESMELSDSEMDQVAGGAIRRPGASSSAMAPGAYRGRMVLPTRDQNSKNCVPW
jgi:hypothetical protein